ncbi:MAG: ABC transporter permease [Pirellulales bacterium]|nr:ABC transporter permease [Pirellulales bacterium]
MSLLAVNWVTWVTPLWVTGVGALVAVAAVVAAYFLLRVAQPRVAAIAVTTMKEGLSQPLFTVVLLLGILLLLIFPFIPYNTFGEDVKVVKDSGLTLITVAGMIVALWSASVSIAEEIEGRTSLTLLSKPVSRRQFIVGKFLGVLGPVVVLFLVLGTLFLASVSYKLAYDAKETANPDPTVEDCRREMLSVAPGLALAFMETVVLTSISVAIATRMPMLANLTICFAVYALGHLVPLLVKAAAGKFAILVFVGQLIATILPVLDHFKIEGAIATSQPVPMAYLGWALLYCVLYSSLALLVALLLFEDRDLA